MWRNKSLQVLVVVLTMAACCAARADVITVLNNSFESPATADYTYSIDNWNTASSNYGVLKNAGLHGNLMANCDGNQFAFMPMWDLTGGTHEMWQDLPSTFEAGKKYTLTVGVGARSDEAAMTGMDLQLRLFYRPAPGSSEALGVAETSVLWDNVSNSSFTDYMATATVAAGNACVGKTMGIHLKSNGLVNGADWSLDNVRLTVESVPEPECIVMLASMIVSLMAYAWRKRK
jgi:hypothetical protein